jgi:hypothetical protein
LLGTWITQLTKDDIGTQLVGNAERQGNSDG